MTLSTQQAQVLEKLESATLAMDAKAVELALNEAFTLGLHNQMSEVLITLADAQWHARHEDVALALQEIGGSVAVSALERLAISEHAYLAYDEHHALARKCTWALADIGTNEARDALSRLTGFKNPVISAFAAKRLENWQHESHRKRGA